MAHRVVAVTGANRGLGLALVRRLASQQLGITRILLCSRDLQKGIDARGVIGQVDTDIDVMQLDMDDEESMERFCSEVKQKYGTLYGLVNNAGMMLNDESMSKEDALIKTCRTNLFGPISLTEQIIDQGLIVERGKLLFLSSTMACTNFIQDKKLAQMLSTIGSAQDINTAYMQVLEQIRDGKYSSIFIPKFTPSDYNVSKLLLSKYAKILSSDTRIIDKDIFVASICPGWCKTDMGGSRAVKTPERGTDIVADMLDEANDYTAKSSLQGMLVNKIGSGVQV